MQRVTEALIDQLIRRQHPALKIFRQKDQSHHHSPQHVSNHDLQKSKVSRKRNSRNADDRQRARLSRDDRERDRPPRNRLVGEKVSSQRPRTRTSATAETKPKKRNTDEVDDNQR